MDQLLLNLKKLKQGNSVKGSHGNAAYAKAPHKPIMLLAVINCFEKGVFFENRVTPNDDLVLSFRDIWNRLVVTNHVPNFALPFFHLKNEKSGFWNLITFPGKTIPTTKSNSIKSFKAIRDNVQCVRLSEPFFKGLMDPVQRELIKQTLLSAYFPDTQLQMQKEIPDYSDQIQKEILYDPHENYARKIKRILKAKGPEVEEELIIRSTVFRKAVKEVYNQQCAISGLKIGFSGRVSLVDACHIVPFAETYDDTITNGIALSPTLHRAFDRGLVAISDDYTILVHPKVRDYSTNPGLLRFQNKPLFLPRNAEFYPSLSHLKHHRKQFGF